MHKTAQPSKHTPYTSLQHHNLLFAMNHLPKVLNLEEHPELCAQTGLKLLRQVSVYGACRIVENASPKEVSNHIEAICAVAQLREELVLRSTCFPSRQQTFMNIDSLTGP